MAASVVGIITQLGAVNDALRRPADWQFGHDTDHTVTSPLPHSSGSVVKGSGDL